MQYSIQTTRKYVKLFLSFARNLYNKYGKQLLDAELDALKTASKIVVHKAAEATGEFIGNNGADKIVTQKQVIAENSRNVEEITILPEKREKILSELREVLQKWSTIKYRGY